MMHVLDGWAFIEAYRAIAEDEIPIIGVSANLTPQVAARLRKLGVRVCLAKPFDLDELIVCAKHVLGSNAAAAMSGAP
jgi:CheY-like chemotaxis protein